ncbi:hypothetical protein ACW9HQ_43735 [Nocardia gipuzkoensis]
MIKTIVVAGSVAFGIVAAGAGLAAAEEIQVEGNYATEAGCNTDAPGVELAKDNGKYTHYQCRQGNDGLWYLYLSN